METTREMSNNMKDLSYIFGPILSRRLGVSLGIDLIPHKTCNLDCVYCECGSTTTHTTTLDTYIDPQAIIDELDAYLKDSPPHIDIITFAGSGEPTLNKGLGTIAEHIRAHYPQYKLGILTNSAGLSNPLVQEELLDFDIILPSVDAMFQKTFEKINRPADGLKCDDILEGVRSFMKRYKGTIWVEYFVLPGVNDSKEELAAFKTYFTEIAPTRVQLNSMDRPGTEEWVQAPELSRLQEIEHFFQPLPVEIISRSAKTWEMPKPSKKNLEQIIDTIARRPQTIEDLAVLYGISINEASNIADTLIASNTIVKSELNNRTYLKVIL